MLLRLIEPSGEGTGAGIVSGSLDVAGVMHEVALDSTSPGMCCKVCVEDECPYSESLGSISPLSLDIRLVFSCPGF